MKHGGLVGTFDRKIGKKAQDIEPKKRSLALRAIAGDRESDSAGVVCWTLTWKPKKTKVFIFYGDSHIQCFANYVLWNKNISLILISIG